MRILKKDNIIIFIHYIPTELLCTGSTADKGSFFIAAKDRVQFSRDSLSVIKITD